MSKSKNKQDALLSAMSMPANDGTATKVLGWREWIWKMSNFLKNRFDKITTSALNKIAASVNERLPPERVINMKALAETYVDGSEVTAMVAKSLAKALTHKIDKPN